jgi:hypothetical protein
VHYKAVALAGMKFSGSSNRSLLRSFVPEQKEVNAHLKNDGFPFCSGSRVGGNCCCSGGL